LSGEFWEEVMRFVKLRLWFGLTTFLISFLAGGPAKSEEKKTDLIYKGEILGADGKPEAKAFNLSKEEKDLEELTALLSKGAVVELTKEETVNPLALTWDLGLWTLVVFLLFYFFLKKIAWRPILEGLKKREDNIRGALDEAQKAREEAQRMREQWQREVDQAHLKVAAILDEGRRNAKALTDEMIAKARAEIQAERDRLRREIENAKDQAVQEIWNQAALLATAISAKAIRRQISAEDHRRLVDEALADLKKTGSA
jgi:F-type H+-transporting ATPase subunit b